MPHWQEFVEVFAIQIFLPGITRTRLGLVRDSVGPGIAWAIPNSGRVVNTLRPAQSGPIPSLLPLLWTVFVTKLRTETLALLCSMAATRCGSTTTQGTYSQQIESS
jgi:hypothetical protein